MIALEIARQKRLTAVVLIGSAVSTAEVQGLLTLLAPFAAITPISLIQLLAGKHTNIIARMFAEAYSHFIKAICRHLPQWPGTKDIEVPFFRIHGQKDHVISCPKVGADIVSNAGHLIAVTHARECGEFLNKIYRQLLIRS